MATNTSIGARLGALSLLLTLSACGDDTSTTTTDGGSDGSSQVSIAPTSDGSSGSDTGTASDPSGTDSDSATTAGPTSDPSATDPSATDPSETDPTTVSCAAAPTTETTDNVTDATTDPPLPMCGNGILEDGEECDDGDQIDKNACSNACTMVPCEEQENGFDEVLSFIWIANSSEGTVSKIDTESAVEVARYRVEGGQPSRTSVNLFGDVAVSSRDPGGVTKIAAKEDDCVDMNNNGMIETSQGPGDVLPLGEDECVVWRKQIPSTGYNFGPRATAWVAGDPDPVSCQYPDPVLWIGWMDNQYVGHFLKINGTDGATIAETSYNWMPATHSPYGGAVDKDGHFYVTGLNQAPTIKIDFDTMAITDLGNPAGCKYGMTLDLNGDIWAGACFGEGVYYWDHLTNTWTTLPNAGGTRVNGIMADADGNVWGAGSNGCRLVHIDVETKSYVNNNIPLPGCSSPWGVSIDYQGYVWVVDMANKAFKVDPDTYQVVAEVGGLVGPYTYSDMTGVALKSQVVIPQ